MKLKNLITLIIIAMINLVGGILLTVFVLPNNIPFLFDHSEKIVNFCPKWIMLIPCILPTIFVVLSLATKNNKVKFFMNMLFILAFYENFLFFTYYSLGTNLNVGQLSEIPISVSIFMPISVIMIVCSIKLKNQPYLSKPAINFKVTRETEFIWKQTHYYAKDVYLITGLILFFISVIFSFVRFPIIEFILFVIAIFVSTLLIYLNSKSLYNKYIEMKTKQDNLKNKTAEKNANSSNNDEKSAKNTSKKQKKNKKKKSIDPNKLF